MANAVAGFKGALGAGKGTGSTDLAFTAVARDRFCRFIDAEFTEDHQAEMDPTSGRAEAEAVALGPYDNRLKATLEGTVEGIVPYLLRSLMGGVTSAQQASTTAYLHTYTRADALAAVDRLTFEKKMGTSAEAKVANGVVNRLRYDFGQRGMVRWSFDALCAKSTYSSSPTSATFPSATTTRLSQYMHTFTFGGSSFVARAGSVEIDTHNMEDDFTATQRFRRDAERGPMEVTCVLEALFQNLNNWRQFMGGVSVTEPGNDPVYYEANVKGEHPTEIVGATGHKYTAEFDMDKCWVEKVGLPVPGKGFIAQSMRLKGIYDSTNGAATVKLKNTATTS